MTVFQRIRIKSEIVALFVVDMVGQLVRRTKGNFSILRDTHCQMTSKRFKVDCLPANAREMADRNQPGKTPIRSPVAPHSEASADTRGVGNL